MGYWDTIKQVLRYSSGGRMITRSNSHKDLWTVTCSDGLSWFAINASQDEILRLNKPDHRIYQTK